MSLPSDQEMSFEPEVPGEPQPQEKQYSPVGSGLVNVGNTCFVNALLQVLIHLPPLVEAMATFGGHANFSCSLCEAENWCALCSLYHLLKKRYEPVSGSPNDLNLVAYEPHHFTRSFPKFAPSFVLGNQEDAHEFLGKVLDALQNAELGLEALAFNRSDESILSQTMVGCLFDGKLISGIMCSGCENVSTTYETFRYVDVPLGAETVEKAINGMVEDEVLSGDSQYHCDKCEGQRDAVKRTALYKAPPILMMNIKRFSPTDFGAKIHTPIHISPSLMLYSDSEAAYMEYRLRATISHHGNTVDSGHYYALVKGHDDGWYWMNDETVTPVREPNVCDDPSAYLLFYVLDGSYGNSS